jgi:hypothetical protein
MAASAGSGRCSHGICDMAHRSASRCASFGSAAGSEERKDHHPRDQNEPGAASTANARISSAIAS